MPKTPHKAASTTGTPSSSTHNSKSATTATPLAAAASSSSSASASLSRRHSRMLTTRPSVSMEKDSAPSASASVSAANAHATKATSSTTTTTAGKAQSQSGSVVVKGGYVVAGKDKEKDKPKDPNNPTPWRHPAELPYICRDDWSQDLIIEYLCQKSFSVPGKEHSSAVQLIQVTPYRPSSSVGAGSTNKEPVFLPRGYRVPLMFVAKFQWESLRLVLTSSNPKEEWEEYKFDIVHISRLCQHLFEQAREAYKKAAAVNPAAIPLPGSASASGRAGSVPSGKGTKTAGQLNELGVSAGPGAGPGASAQALKRTHTAPEGVFDKTWRSPMFDRVLTRFYRKWFVSRDWSLKNFYEEFDEEEYEIDVLKYDWARWAIKGHKGFMLTKEEVLNGITAEQYMRGLGKTKDGVWTWVTPSSSPTIHSSVSVNPYASKSTSTPTGVVASAPQILAQAEASGNAPPPAITPTGTAPAPGPLTASEGASDVIEITGLNGSGGANATGTRPHPPPFATVEVKREVLENGALAPVGNGEKEKAANWSGDRESSDEFAMITHPTHSDPQPDITPTPPPPPPQKPSEPRKSTLAKTAASVSMAPPPARKDKDKEKGKEKERGKEKDKDKEKGKEKEKIKKEKDKEKGKEKEKVKVKTSSSSASQVIGKKRPREDGDNGKKAAQESISSGPAPKRVRTLQTARKSVSVLSYKKKRQDQAMAEKIDSHSWLLDDPSKSSAAAGEEEEESDEEEDISSSSEEDDDRDGDYKTRAKLTSGFGYKRKSSMNGGSSSGIGSSNPFSEDSFRERMNKRIKLADSTSLFSSARPYSRPSASLLEMNPKRREPESSKAAAWEALVKPINHNSKTTTVSSSTLASASTSIPKPVPRMMIASPEPVKKKAPVLDPVASTSTSSSHSTATPAVNKSATDTPTASTTQTSLGPQKSSTRPAEGPVSGFSNLLSMNGLSSLASGIVGLRVPTLGDPRVIGSTAQGSHVEPPIPVDVAASWQRMRVWMRNPPQSLLELADPITKKMMRYMMADFGYGPSMDKEATVPRNVGPVGDKEKGKAKEVVAAAVAERVSEKGKEKEVERPPMTSEKGKEKEVVREAGEEREDEAATAIAEKPPEKIAQVGKDVAKPPAQTVALSGRIYTDEEFANLLKKTYTSKRNTLQSCGEPTGDMTGDKVQATPPPATRASSSASSVASVKDAATPAPVAATQASSSVDNSPAPPAVQKIVTPAPPSPSSASSMSISASPSPLHARPTSALSASVASSDKEVSTTHDAKSPLRQPSSSPSFSGSSFVSPSRDKVAPPPPIVTPTLTHPPISTQPSKSPSPITKAPVLPSVSSPSPVLPLSTASSVVSSATPPSKPIAKPDFGSVYRSMFPERLPSAPEVGALVSSPLPSVRDGSEPIARSATPKETIKGVIGAVSPERLATPPNVPTPPVLSASSSSVDSTTKKAEKTGVVDAPLEASKSNVSPANVNGHVSVGKSSSMHATAQLSRVLLPTAAQDMATTAEEMVREELAGSLALNGVSNGISGSSLRPGSTFVNAGDKMDVDPPPVNGKSLNSSLQAPSANTSNVVLPPVNGTSDDKSDHSVGLLMTEGNRSRSLHTILLLRDLLQFLLVPGLSQTPQPLGVAETADGHPPDPPPVDPRSYYSILEGEESMSIEQRVDILAHASIALAKALFPFRGSEAELGTRIGSLDSRLHEQFEMLLKPDQRERALDILNKATKDVNVEDEKVEEGSARSLEEKEVQTLEEEKRDEPSFVESGMQTEVEAPAEPPALFVESPPRVVFDQGVQAEAVEAKQSTEDERVFENASIQTDVEAQEIRSPASSDQDTLMKWAPDEPVRQPSQLTPDATMVDLTAVEISSPPLETHGSLRRASDISKILSPPSTDQTHPATKAMSSIMRNIADLIEYSAQDESTTRSRAMTPKGKEREVDVGTDVEMSTAVQRYSGSPVVDAILSEFRAMKEELRVSREKTREELDSIKSLHLSGLGSFEDVARSKGKGKATDEGVAETIGDLKRRHQEEVEQLRETIRRMERDKEMTRDRLEEERIPALELLELRRRITSLEARSRSEAETPGGPTPGPHPASSPAPTHMSESSATHQRHSSHHPLGHLLTHDFEEAGSLSSPIPGRSYFREASTNPGTPLSGAHPYSSRHADGTDLEDTIPLPIKSQRKMHMMMFPRPST